MAKKKTYLVSGVVVKNPKGEKVIVLNQNISQRPVPDNLIFQTDFEKRIIDELGLEEDDTVFVEMIRGATIVYGSGCGF